MGKSVVIIGSGVGGLATACLLGQAGYTVTVYEKNAQPGGRLGRFKEAGFTFDSGPSWYLMPDVFEHFFGLLGEDVNKLLNLKRLYPSYQIFFKDTILGATPIYDNAVKNGSTFESLEPGARERMKEYLKNSSDQYSSAMKKFLYKNNNSWVDLLNPELIGAGFRLNLLTSMDKYTAKHFSSTEIQKILQFPCLFLGTNPKATPALYKILNHSTLAQGVYYPAGGMYELTKTLVQLAENRGVTIHLNTPVDKIIVKNGLAEGVIAGGQEILADIVISNADIEYTEHALLPKESRAYTKQYWKKRVMAPSALLMYLGVKGSYPVLSHHNLVFARDWNANFKELFKSKKWPKDPSFYVCNPNKTDHSVAPEDHENLFVLVPVSTDVKYSAQSLDLFSEEILKTMEQTMHLPRLRERITYKRVFAVKDFEQHYNSYKGSALGLAHTLKQSSVFRPSNLHKKVPNLLFVGANTSPGVGLPMCLISAELAYKRLTNDRSAGPLKSI